MRINILTKKTHKTQMPMAMYCSRPELKANQKRRRELSKVRAKQATKTH